MSRNSATIAFNGLKDIDKNLKAIAGKIERGSMRHALMKAATPMLKESRIEARKIEKTGTLRKSLKKKTKTSKLGVVSVFIGPDRQVTSTDYGGKHTPANIAHLIEFDHKSKSGGIVQGAGFLEKAFKKTKGETMRIYSGELKSSIKTIAKRMERKIAKI